MSVLSGTQIRRLTKLCLGIVFFLGCSNGATAAVAVNPVGSGSIDEWLALGLAMLAALYCVQKRE